MINRIKIKARLSLLLLMVMAMGCWQISRSAIAETCPNIATIQQQLPKGWAFFDSEDGKPLSQERALQYKKSVKQFALAEWQSNGKDRKGGSIHCYYRDQNGSDLEAYVAKENYIPVNLKNFWYQVSGHMHCAAGANECPFKDEQSDGKRLART